MILLFPIYTIISILLPYLLLIDMKIRSNDLILLFIIKIQQVAHSMKPKKKTVPAQKKAEKKQALVKPLMLIDKTIATTKQKTNTTIEDHFQISQFRHCIRTNKNLTPRNSCQQKLKDKDMSPFSSSGGQSISPKYRKITSPQPQGERKAKPKSNLLLDKPCEKIKSQFIKREGKIRQKVTKEQFNQANYQNLLLRRMDEKRITEMSDQSSSSIPKISRLKLNIVTHQNKFKSPTNHQVIVSQLKNSIKSKYQRQFPCLRSKELTFLCSIVFIQRFWRQNRIKHLINQYIQPKGALHSVQSYSNRDKNTLKLDQTTQEQTLELIRKYNYPSSPKVKNNSHQQECFNLQSFESSQLNSQKQIKMIKFVQCLKDISFYKPKKQERKLKINIFSLKQSLSQNCLMQKFYGKIFKVEITKRNALQLFGLKKDDKSLQRSIQLIKTMRTPEKIEIQQRFETQLQEKQSLQPKSKHCSVSVQTDSVYFERKQKSSLSTLQQLSLVTESLVFSLLNEFSEEFHSFTSRSILRKKKKVRMPGLKVDSNNIRQYLQGLSSYMLSQYGSEILRRWSLIKPVSFLKLHHEYQEEDEDQQSDIPVIPNSIFYEYQIIYQQTIFKISQQDKKYCNFLEGLIKIHNILLANCMSEILQKSRMDRVNLPWDNCVYANHHYIRQDLQNDLKAITNTICRYSSMRIGQFHKRLDDPQEQKKILRSINEEYKNEGNDWGAQHEYLQTRMELEKAIQEMLYLQAIDDLTVFF